MNFNSKLNDIFMIAEAGQNQQGLLDYLVLGNPL